MKNVDERLKRLESMTHKLLKGRCTFEDGTTQIIDVLHILLRTLDNTQPKITGVTWIGDRAGNGVLPEIAEMMIAEPAPNRNIEDFTGGTE